MNQLVNIGTNYSFVAGSRAITVINQQVITVENVARIYNLTQDVMLYDRSSRIRKGDIDSVSNQTINLSDGVPALATGDKLVILLWLKPSVRISTSTGKPTGTADNIDTTDGTVIYKGFKNEDGTYTISKTTIANNLITTLWSSGAWANRLTLIYS